MNTYLWAVAQPSHLILYTALIGVVLWRSRIAALCRKGSIAMLLLFGFLPTAWLITRPLEQRFGFPVDLHRVDGIIVLAGAERGRLSAFYGEPQLNRHADRLTTFLMLAERFPNARLLHSGSAGPQDNQSVVARAVLLGAGLDPNRVQFEDRSRDTCESAVVSRDLLHPGPSSRWLLVTSAMHMPRAVACFRAAGWSITPYPADFVTTPEPFHSGLVENLADFDAAAHEWLGLLYYRVRGSTKELFPAPEPTVRQCATAAC